MLLPSAQTQVQRAWAMAIQYERRVICGKHTSPEHVVNASASIA